MKYINILFDFFFGSLSKFLSYAMLHVKLCLVAFALSIIFIILVAILANKGKIFGFWWQLNRALDKFVNIGLVITSILLAIVIIIIGIYLLAVYKGL